MREIFPDLWQAFWTTLQISGWAIAIGLTVGLGLGVLRTIGPRWLQLPIRMFVSYMRGVPPLVPIAIVYFALPYYGITLDEYWTGVVALAAIAAGYTVEIVRAGLESVDPGQRDAALAVGMDDTTALLFVLLPQAAPQMVPPLTNEMANAIKASSLLSVISVNELTKVGNDLIFEHFIAVEVLLEVAVLYLLIVGTLTRLSRYLEMRWQKFRPQPQSLRVG
jgi:polar amino acid transport system permease protein